MQTPKEFEEVAKSLQGLALAGESIPEMLKFVKTTLGSRPVAAAACFSIAFSADLADVSAVSGWTGFGHELADESVIAIVLPVVTKWLHDADDTSSKVS